MCNDIYNVSFAELCLALTFKKSLLCQLLFCSVQSDIVTPPGGQNVAGGGDYHKVGFDRTAECGHGRVFFFWGTSAFPPCTREDTCVSLNMCNCRSAFWTWIVCSIWRSARTVGDAAGSTAAPCRPPRGQPLPAGHVRSEKFPCIDKGKLVKVWKCSGPVLRFKSCSLITLLLLSHKLALVSYLQSKFQLKEIYLVKTC